MCVNFIDFGNAKDVMGSREGTVLVFVLRYMIELLSSEFLCIHIFDGAGQIIW